MVCIYIDCTSDGNLFQGICLHTVSAQSALDVASSSLSTSDMLLPFSISPYHASTIRDLTHVYRWTDYCVKYMLHVHVVHFCLDSASRQQPHPEVHLRILFKTDCLDCLGLCASLCWVVSLKVPDRVTVITYRKPNIKFPF